MTTHSTITLSQAIWIYGTGDVDELNARFSADATALGYGLRLYAVASLETILIVYLSTDPALADSSGTGLQIMNLGLV
jgi:hypothetical protein